MARKLRPAAAEEVSAALGRRAGGGASAADVRLLVKHFLAVLAERAPGGSVEVRVPPYAAVQAVPGVRHTRGTPPAVVEADAETWLELAVGESTWDEVVAAGRIQASGQRADLAPYLPLG